MQLSHSFSSLKLYENCPLRYYNQRIIKAVVDKGGEASQYGERIHKFLEDRLKDGTPLPPEASPIEGAVAAIKRLIGDGELHVEKELTLNQNLEPTGWWAKDAWVRSKLDVLIIRGDEAFNIDWKTGKRRPDFTQLELFALQVFAHYPYIEKVTGSFVWIKDVALDKEAYRREDTPKLWETFLTRVQRVEQSLAHDNWPARPSGLCNYCPCKPTCAYAR
jgi:hypothetical protein